MIALVIPASAERAALLSLFESRGWATLECHSVRGCIRSLRRHLPRVVVTRHRLSDAFSDDILVWLRASGLTSPPRAIVLVDADTPTELEVRQLTLGADCVLRYPIRADVLAAYVAKFYTTNAERRVAANGNEDSNVAFCGAVLNPLERTLQMAGTRAPLTPREVILIELLVDSRGSVVSYERLYSEVLGRKFCGDTSNMRVLLGKLGNSCRKVGLQLRQYVKVVPKGGYQYDGYPSQSTKPAVSG